jgi:O-antigen/teichoic acid export membrane protein
MNSLHVGHRLKVARNSVGFLVVVVVGHLYTLATVPLLTRWLSPPEWGFFTILVQLNTILQFATLALFSQSLLKFYVEYEPVERKRFVGTALLAVVLIHGMFVVGLYLSRSWSLPALYPNLNLPLDPYIGWACLWFWAAPLRMFGFSLLKIQERVRPLLGLNLAYGLVLFVALLILVIRGASGLKGTIQSMAFAEWACLGLTTLVLKPEIRITMVWAYLARCVTFAIPLLGSTLCFLLVNNLDRWVLSRHVDLSSLGVYGVGAMIGNTLGLVVTASMTSITPRIIKVMWKEGDTAAASLVSAMIEDVLVFVGVPFGLLCLGGELLVPLLGGSSPRWAVAGAVLIGVASGHFVRGMYLTAQNVLFYKERTGLLLLNNLMLLGIALLISFLLVSGGSACIAWLLAASYLLLAPVTLRLARRLLPLSFNLRSSFVPIVGILIVVTISLTTWAAGWNWADLRWLVSRGLGLVVLIITCGGRLRGLLYRHQSGSDSGTNLGRIS